jgi:hypothetical protein
VAHGLGHGVTGAAVAAWPAVALVGSYKLLMMIIRSARARAGTATGSTTSGAPGDDLLQAQAVEEFAGEVAGGRVPSVRVIRARLHVGRPRAQRARAYLDGCRLSRRVGAVQRARGVSYLIAGCSGVQPMADEESFAGGVLDPPRKPGTVAKFASAANAYTDLRCGNNGSR